MRRATTPEALARKVLNAPAKRRNQGTSAVTRLRRQALSVGVMLEQDTLGHVTCIRLQGFNALSWQVLWRGTDHHARTIAKRAYSQPVANALLNTPTPIRQHEQPVTVAVNVHGKGNLIDPDNICVKPIIDVLKGVVISDDTGNEIAELRVRVRRSEEPYPYMVITLQEAA